MDRLSLETKTYVYGFVHITMSIYVVLGTQYCIMYME